MRSAALRCSCRAGVRVPLRARCVAAQAAHASSSAASSASAHRPSTDPLTVPPPPLDAAALASAAVLARAAGAAYAYDDAGAASRLAPDGLTLAASGETWFTKWLVIDGPPPSPASAARPPSRIISIRGVVWGREGPLDGWRLWRSIARAYPGQLTPAGGGPPIPGVSAHAGAAALAEELWHHIRSAVRGAPAGADVTLVGHSLGGALALLAAAAAAAAGERPLGVTQFGAPPVLAADGSGSAGGGGGGGGGPAVLAATGLLHAPVRSFVAAGDPVPRAGLSAADPAVAAAAAAWAPVASAARSLGLGAWLDGGSGGATATAGRPASLFPAGYDPVGDTYLVSWTPDAGHAVRPLAPASVGAALVAAAPETVASVAAAAASAAADNAPTSPLSVPAAARRALGAWLDHAHTSYADDLAAAAVQAKKMEGGGGGGGGGARKKKGGGGGGGG